ncbi:hypothetical protein QC764_209130 [Podospora pseudoanserina]|uniref:Uncharacterized protein n=1 Tax=Podospora pseudoanserina TaxID=2609844 RepID=A0ABR0IIJ4_9PEZI|nr:hypothetical protein QC764_209130 [Podospora pseudoanserina]
MLCFSPRILSSTRTADNAYIDHGKAKSVNSPNISFCGFRRKDNDSGININTEKVNFSAHNYQAVDFAQLGFSCRRVIPFCGSRGKYYGVDISRDNAGNVNLNTCHYGAGVVCAWGFCCCLSIIITPAGALCFRDIDNHFGIDINGFRNLSIDTDDHSSTRASRIIAIAIAAIAAIVTTIIVAVIGAIVAIFTAVTAIIIAVIPVLTVIVAVTATISSISITIASITIASITITSITIASITITSITITSITIASITAPVILMILIIPMSSHHLRHPKPRAASMRPSNEQESLSRLTHLGTNSAGERREMGATGAASPTAARREMVG